MNHSSEQVPKFDGGLGSRVKPDNNISFRHLNVEMTCQI